jgi:dTDP-4-dehydrorhamnose 3,5-epimerase
MLSTDEPIFLTSSVYKDERGFFIELFRESNFAEKFVQDNFSYSIKNVFRGLHLQTKNPQGKLVTCLKGKILDIVVDCDKNSKNFGRLYKYALKDGNQLYVPPKFAHGFYCISDEAFIMYKCTEYYNPDSEVSISVKQFEEKLPEINFSDAIISLKDKQGIMLNEY